MAEEAIMATTKATTPIPIAATFPAMPLTINAKAPPRPAIMTNTNTPNDPFCLIPSPFYRSKQERISFDIQKDGDDWVNSSCAFPAGALSPDAPRETQDNPVESASLWGEHPMISQGVADVKFRP